MYLSNIKEAQSIVLNGPGILNARKQSLVGPEQGWDGWVMRQFTLGKDGQTPKHSHPWPHINYIISGKGTLFLDGKEQSVESGSVAYIPGGEEHQFRNVGDEEFAFICIVPEEGDK
ncbi:cupin domain-containing protein [Heliobacillus mobilis]|uniref:Cupin domain-containing protein n=1 Tax=Heliobacterium mobile TaxID=28064 RepID=A0A6I3SBV9_HELMO|nr:cupin domain-containing protein [Heliobacterium mobile]MTV47848.1 cupin domain-containing protein [Heliobacterium mobile]